MEHNITTPLCTDDISKLKSGDTVNLTGYIYTARDAAHKIMCESLSKGEKLPMDIKGAVIYFAGPCPAKPGRIIGSCGPTTSYRMDKYSPALLNLGLLGMIGKGTRSEEVKKSIIKNKAVYFAALGGAGALIAKCVKSSEVIAYEHLGTEAVRKLYVENMPLIVAIDSEGNCVYER